MWCPPPSYLSGTHAAVSVVHSSHTFLPLCHPDWWPIPSLLRCQRAGRLGAIVSIHTHEFSNLHTYPAFHRTRDVPHVNAVSLWGRLTVSLFSPVPIHQSACKVTANNNTNNSPSTIKIKIKTHISLLSISQTCQCPQEPPRGKKTCQTMSSAELHLETVLMASPPVCLHPSLCLPHLLLPRFLQCMLGFISVVAAPSTSWFWQSRYLCSGMVLCDLIAFRRHPNPLLRAYP